MTQIQCPRCGREVAGAGRFWGGGKPSCPPCGWNVDQAKTLSSTNQNLATIYFFGLALFIAAMGASAPSASQHRLRFIAFAFLLVMLALIARHRKKLRNSMQAQYAATAPAAPGAFAMPANPASISYERLMMLRRPRAIRLKTLSRIFAVAYVVSLGGAGCALLAITKNGGAKADFSAFSNLFPFAMFVLIWSIMAVTMFRAMLRDRSLLSDGEIAVATITSQSFAGGESRTSRITYDFKDAAGRSFSGKCTDRTRKLFEEMQAPVFYDPANPAKNVALAGATYDVVES